MGSSDQEGFSRPQNNSHLLLSPWGQDKPWCGGSCSLPWPGSRVPPVSVDEETLPSPPSTAGSYGPPPAPQLRPTAKKQASLSAPTPPPLTRLPLVSCSPGTRLSLTH